MSQSSPSAAPTAKSLIRPSLGPGAGPATTPVHVSDVYTLCQETAQLLLKVLAVKAQSANLSVKQYTAAYFSYVNEVLLNPERDLSPEKASAIQDALLLLGAHRAGDPSLGHRAASPGVLGTLGSLAAQLVVEHAKKTFQDPVEVLEGL